MIHRQLVLPVAAALILTAFAPTPAPAQPAAGKPFDPRAQAIADLVLANHILADQGVVDGFGHVSVRDPSDPNKFFLARSMAPELVTSADILEHDLDGNAPAAGNAKLYLERFIHAEIYRARPDVIAIVHCHAPDLIPFGATGVALRPIYHMSSFLGGGVPVFDIRKAVNASTDMLIRTPELGKALVKSLAAHPVALMRGHGAVIVGKDLQSAVFRSVYTELNAKLQAQAMTLGSKITFLDPDEARKSEETNTPLVGRSWELWVRKVGGK
ncbi:MAG TPA: class II aldolase/adducin family protein [Kofleriaceae bacterium]|jgi:HCOMODA/2-hydroxy-3-carboxy-muconic semialdehyde decarboxylase|nr:class II aldolase/adducin family protein [Kofleriaceae bacterium]